MWKGEEEEVEGGEDGGREGGKEEKWRIYLGLNLIIVMGSRGVFSCGVVVVIR